MKTEIGAYDAKTRLPELLRQVKAGKRFTITNRGAAIVAAPPPTATCRHGLPPPIACCSRQRGA